MRLPTEHLVDAGATAALFEAIDAHPELPLAMEEASIVGGLFIEALPDIITVELIMAWLVEAGYRAAHGKLLPLAKVVGPKDMEIRLLRRELELARRDRDRYRQTLGVVKQLAGDFDAGVGRPLIEAIEAVS